MSALIARFWSIAKNLSPEIVAPKLVALKVIPLQKSLLYDPLSFKLVGSSGLVKKMTLQQTNTADLQLRQHTGEPNSLRNQLTKTEAKVVSGRFSGGLNTCLPIAHYIRNILRESFFLSSGRVYQTRIFTT